MLCQGTRGWRRLGAQGECVQFRRAGSLGWETGEERGAAGSGTVCCCLGDSGIDKYAGAGGPRRVLVPSRVRGCRRAPAPSASCNGGGRKHSPPLAWLIALKARETGAQGLALFKGTLITLKQNQEELAAGAQHFTFPSLPCCSSGVCVRQPSAQPLCSGLQHPQRPAHGDFGGVDASQEKLSATTTKRDSGPPRV